MQKKNHTIGLRADALTITLLNDAAQIFNISKSEVLRNALASTYGASVLGYKSNLMEVPTPLN
jgi:hypothetical protein